MLVFVDFWQCAAVIATSNTTAAVVELRSHQQKLALGDSLRVAVRYVEQSLLYTFVALFFTVVIKHFVAAAAAEIPP